MKNIRLAALTEREKTVVRVDGMCIGEGFTVIAGPCSVESEEQTIETARAVKKARCAPGGFKQKLALCPGLGLKAQY